MFFSEDNYNIILDEYKKFKFNIIEDNTSDENWMMWKMAHEHSLEITKNFRKDLDWDERHSLHIKDHIVVTD